MSFLVNEFILYNKTYSDNITVLGGEQNVYEGRTTTIIGINEFQ